MVIRECILKATEILRASGADTAALDARVLIAAVLDKNDVYIITNPDVNLNQNDEERFFEYVKRRAEGEPVAYIVGEKEFMSLMFYVDDSVLIPRPDTEHLAELAIELIEENKYKKAADFCTGSGALAVSVAKAHPNVFVDGYDISSDALGVANRNKTRNSTPNVNFYRLDVLGELDQIGQKYDIVVSNPPYISREDMSSLDNTVSGYEPHLALFGGEDGLDFYRKISADADNFLEDGGVLAFEVGHSQAEDVKKIMESNFDNIQIKKDYAGIARVVWGTKKQQI